MNSLFPLGPDARAQWESQSIGGDNCHPLCLLLLPDAGNTRAANGSGDHNVMFYYLPQTPSLARRQGRQIAFFSLTLVLSRTPGPDDEFILPLVERGQLAFTLDLSVPGGSLEWLEENWHNVHPTLPDASFRPLFARSIHASLFAANTDTPLVTVNGAGSDARLALSASLNRAQALAVSDAPRRGGAAAAGEKDMFY